MTEVDQVESMETNRLVSELADARILGSPQNVSAPSNEEELTKLKVIQTLLEPGDR